MRRRTVLTAMPHVRAAGMAIHYEAVGTGPPALCLVHGSGGTGAVWTRQMEALADVARIVALDLPGHGGSEGADIGTIADASRIVHASADALGLGRIVLGGHSMGGAVAQAFALMYPDRLAGLVLVGTGARLRVHQRIFDELATDYPHGVRYVTELALAPDAPAELVASLARAGMRASPQAHVTDFRACDAFDVMDRLDKIRTPTLVICGDGDRLTPPKYARYL